MDDMSPNTTEITEPLLAAPADIEALRAAVVTGKAALQETEMAIATAELRQAEELHVPLAAQLKEAQLAFDTLDKQTDSQRHLYFRAATRKSGSVLATDTERRNRPRPDWDSGRPDRADAQSEWTARMTAHLAEERAADADHGIVYAELSRLQGLRRAAVKELERVSWEESYARDAVTECQEKLKKSQPKGAVRNAYAPVPDSLIVVVGNY
jgi:hypothetical protein